MATRSRSPAGRLLNGLHWPKDVDAAAWQPRPTIYERAAAAGVAAVHVAPGAFKNSGLTTATLRGAEYRAANSLGALAARTVDALGESDRVLVSAYHGQLDGCGHEYGVSSPAWVNELAHVDKLAEQIAAGLPYGSVLYVTADHGMVNVGPTTGSTPTRKARRCGTAWRCLAASRGPGTSTRSQVPPTTSSPPGGRCSASAPG